MPKATSIKKNLLAKIFRRINWSVSQWWKVEQEGLWVEVGQHSSHTDSYNSTVLSLSYPCCCSSVTDKTDLLGGQVMCLTNHKWKSEQQIQKINPAMCWSFSEQAGKHAYIHTCIIWQPDIGFWFSDLNDNIGTIYLQFCNVGNFVPQILRQGISLVQLGASRWWLFWL